MTGIKLTILMFKAAVHKHGTEMMRSFMALC